MVRSSKQNSTSCIREVVIREQLKKMLPHVETIEIIFCAHEMSKQIDGHTLDPHYNGGKC